MVFGKTVTVTMAGVKNGEGFIENRGECPSSYPAEDSGLAANDSRSKMNFSDILFGENDDIEMNTYSDGLDYFIDDYDPVKSAVLTWHEIAAAFLTDVSTESSPRIEQVTRLSARQGSEVASSDSGSENETCPRFENNKYYLHKMPLKERETYSCDYCDRTYLKKSSLSDHIKQRHLRITPHYCELCGEGFTQPGKLKTHKIIHSDERRYSCEICKKSYKRKSALNDHKRKGTCIATEISEHHVQNTK